MYHFIYKHRHLNDKTKPTEFTSQILPKNKTVHISPITFTSNLTDNKTIVKKQIDEEIVRNKRMGLRKSKSGFVGMNQEPVKLPELGDLGNFQSFRFIIAQDGDVNGKLWDK